MLLAALALSVAAAQSDPWANVDPSGQTVVYWHQLAQKPGEALTSLVDNFNNNAGNVNPQHITVKAEYQGSYPDIFKKFLPLIKSSGGVTSDAPDLLIAYPNQAATYQLGNALINMDSLIGSAKWGLTDKEKADFIQGPMKADRFSIFGNAQLGFPVTLSENVMFYNMSWLKQLGYDSPPKTPQQFEEMACKAAKTPFVGKDGKKISGPTGYEFVADASTLATWTFAFGGNIFDNQTNQFTLNSDAAIKAMQFIQDLFNKGCAIVPTQAYGDQTDFGAGKALFTVGSTAGLTYYRAAVEQGANFDWSVTAPSHTTAKPVVNVFAPSLSMTNTGNKKKQLAAWLFVKYITSPDAQAKLAEVSNYYPVRQSASADLSDYFASHPAYKEGFKLLQDGNTEPPVPGYDFVRDNLQKQLALIVQGADVKQTLDAFNKQANQTLADQLSQLKGQ
jgi:multiple sugar transport system substrate-binding protein/sn-glycerol 3-phosphate transport system substrate-binding protein